MHIFNCIASELRMEHTTGNFATFVFNRSKESTTRDASHIVFCGTCIVLHVNCKALCFNQRHRCNRMIAHTVRVQIFVCGVLHTAPERTIGNRADIGNFFSKIAAFNGREVYHLILKRTI